jgi:hypothetical protein
MSSLLKPWNVVWLGCWLVSSWAAGLDHVSTERDGRPLHLTGQIVTEAVDGGVLLRDREGVLWAVPAEEITRRSRDDQPYQPMSRAELSARMTQQLPGFRLHDTANYLIAYNTSPAYAQWCGALYERLYRAFRNYWERRGFVLRNPDMPLIVLVFDTRDSYANYARAELGDAVGNVFAYYSLQSNRVVMHDLTSSQAKPGEFARATNSAQINRLLARPGAEWMVATIIHEATHQLAYNCGFHTRLADIPLWVSEGLAVYFETPDLESTRGWRNIGGIHPTRLEQFRRYLSRRDADSLVTLITDDNRFRHPQSAEDAYAEAWALTYFVIRRFPKQYHEYLRLMADKPPLIYDTPEERLETFKNIFGEDLQALDAQFLDYMRTVR